jgi:hypothetical protein
MIIIDNPKLPNGEYIGIITLNGDLEIPELKYKIEGFVTDIVIRPRTCQIRVVDDTIVIVK